MSRTQVTTAEQLAPEYSCRHCTMQDNATAFPISLVPAKEVTFLGWKSQTSFRKLEPDYFLELAMWILKKCYMELELFLNSGS